jgi:hypothetical protein
MKTPAQAAVDTVIGRALTPALKALGYRKGGRTFRRTLPRCVHVVNVQSSASSSATEARFTLNLGVYFPEAHSDALCGSHRSGAAGPQESDCCVRARIGTLAGRGDTWWTVRSGGDAAAAESELHALVVQHALPWLERMSEPRLARGSADSACAIALALVEGDRDGAKALAAQALAESPSATGFHAWTRSLGLLPR